MLTKLKQISLIFGIVTLLSACASTKAHYSLEGMASIKSIAVMVPAKTHYTVSTSQGVMFVGGAGILVNLVAGAVHSVGAADREKKMNSFNDLVIAKIGDTGLNRKFVDALEAELRAEGYVVSEVDLSQDNMPKVVYDKDQNLTLQGPAYTGADAILVAQVNPTYFAVAAIAPFNRHVTSDIKIFKSSTLEPVFQEHLYFERSNDKYYYMSVADLIKDLPRAVDGLNEAVMDFVPEISANLRASREAVKK